MIDIKKQIDYWSKGAQEEHDFAARLLAEKNFRHGLFFWHLTLEKIIKAHVCKRTGDLAPRSHNLVRLSEIADLKLSEEDRAFLAGMTRFNIEGRYPEPHDELPSIASIEHIKSNSERLYQWLHEQL